jgi:membrane protein DedA with SNARE-associated domain
MTELIIEHIEWAAANAYTWGFILIFILMAIESSFIPLPSEVIMIPAGFLAYRGDLTFGDPHLDALIVILCGMTGSIVGAYVNYFLARLVGRPIIYRYGKYVFIKPELLSRAEEIFLEFGEISTFVGRLILGIRHLISLPAGLSRMPLMKFTLFTALGAGIWCAILTWIGYYLGTLSAEMTYAQLVYKGKDILKEDYIWIFLCLAFIVAVYAMIHHLVMRSKKID